MRHGCMFSDRLSESEDGSRHTDGREPQHRSSVERVAPSCLRRRIAVSANEVPRSILLHGIVVQDTLHVELLDTLRVHQRLC